MSLDIKTQEQLNTDMLGNISDDYEKSTGFLTADLVKTYSIELSKVYLAIEKIMEKFDVDLLSGDELEKFINQRKGISRKQATYAKVALTITGNNAGINIGDVFSTAGNIQFQSLDTKLINGTNTITAQCTQSGSIGMVGANSITLMPITIAGVTNITNLQPSYDGFDAESDNDLRNRYYEALRTPITSANKYHYLQWAKSVTGVGNAKVIPLWNGANTVKVIIIDANMQPASGEIVTQVQSYIDPAINGLGDGQAPIGAFCTVVSATGKAIDISVDVEIADGYSLDDVKQNFETKLREYLKSIAFSETVKYVSLAKIGQLIMETDGVLDYQNLLVNAGTANITIGDNEVGIVGTITIS
ncbi:baseplate J/gp47 family protein [Schinkia azotoformans]|uniref:baseplate J/gp47 family protein n=1 Tax=Schinkia azotoformans TaxID=1454 RepID=UPI002DBE7F82|nr:baseplate J/gp47 family protein [Schinkia azotoformans]MEC1757369.1 baseplate J/gp47 family protein [Schinkia azotoformans]